MVLSDQEDRQMRETRESRDHSEASHFGFRAVPLAEKQALVDDVFRSVASRYDLMNDLMSGGLHRAWKNALVAALNPRRPRASAGSPARSEERAFWVLDLAGGTGDMAFRAIAAGGSRTRATVADINPDMLAVGRARAVERGISDAISFVEANAEALPFPDRSFDAVTIAFGIRNVPRIKAALAEARRVLAIGGRFLCLEFSTVDVPALDALYDFYSFNIIPALGRAVAGDAEAYRYLVESIRRFPQPEAFAGMMRAAGFARVSFRPISGGIVALHSGWRL
jgi:demethylmenaquinone methyltransferase/2-methoxy-6-polyprenyl-1,4-benzoquinol methylase